MSLERLLKKVYELPSIPKVVQDLIENFNSDTASADVISKNIQSDPVISAKVLRLANSVRYGAGRKVASLDSAVVLLGTSTLKTLVVASGITGSFKSIPKLDAKEFWRNSFMVANISKLIAKNSKGCDPEVAFTCGMLHNIGIALMYFGHPDEMEKLDQDSNGLRTEREKQHFGYDNNQVGAALARIWKFPEVVVSALANQGDPLANEPFSVYAAIIKLAEQIHENMEQGIDREEIVINLPVELTGPLNMDSLNLFDQLALALSAEDDIEELLSAA